MTKTKNVNPPSQTKHKAKTKLTRTTRPEIKIETRVVTKVHEYYLPIIPRARMGSESIAHETEGRMGY